MSNQRRNQITIIGVGGHGSNAFIELLTNDLFSNTDVHLIIGSDDNGGHTGILQGVLEKMYPDTDPAKFLPVGDLRGNISRLLFYKGEIQFAHDDEMRKLYSDLADLMNERITFTGDKEIFLEKCQEFCMNFGLGDECTDFKDFCELYLQNLSSDDELGVKHSLGNLFLSYMMVVRHKFNLEGFFSELKRFELVPENVHFHYFTREKLVLEGGYEIRTRDKVRTVIYVGESNVDKAPHALDPGKYLLKKTNGDILTDPDPEILELISRSDLLVFSCGSVANLLGQVNVLAEKLRKYIGEIMWIANIFKGRNEVGIEDLAEYFLLLGLNPHILTLDNENTEALYTFSGISESALQEYAEEGKTVNDINGLLKVLENYSEETGVTCNVIPILSVLPNRDGKVSKLKRLKSLGRNEVWELANTIGNIGIKHESRVLSILLDFMADLIYLLCYELKYDRHKCREVFKSFMRGLIREHSVKRLYAEILILCKIMAEGDLPAVKLKKIRDKIEFLGGLSYEQFAFVYKHYHGSDPDLFAALDGTDLDEFWIEREREGNDDRGMQELKIK